jgi:hypothetical protein
MITDTQQLEMLNIYEALQQNLTHLEKFTNLKSRSNFLIS